VALTFSHSNLIFFEAILVIVKIKKGFEKQQSVGFEICL
jgi:hypothetical protein